MTTQGICRLSSLVYPSKRRTVRRRRNSSELPRWPFVIWVTEPSLRVSAAFPHTPGNEKRSTRQQPSRSTASDDLVSGSQTRPTKVMPNPDSSALSVQEMFSLFFKYGTMDTGLPVTDLLSSGIANSWTLFRRLPGGVEQERDASGV
jgi:hypothetical protein